ncbi:MAG TPA: vWA domain-containing protein [Haliangiales bacterium]|nr:vWA domain-containing protein [Haliangiales bacterium]
MVLLAGCPSRDISKLEPEPTKEVYKEIPVTSNRNIDILVMVDNSDSMREEQANLATNFPRFIQVLDGIEGGRPNIHLGVVSSDLGIPPYAAESCTGTGDHGLLQNAPRVTGCSPPNGGARFLEDIALPSGARQTNYSGSLASAFSCIAQLGTTGCGLEHHLAAVKKALDGSNPENAGFLRQGAYLAVILVGDEDDCSARDTAVFNPARELDNINSTLGVFASYRCTEFGVTCDGLSSLPRAAGDYTNCEPRGDSYLYHPQEYVDFLRQLKGDPGLVIAAAIIGNPTPFGVFINDKGAPELKNSCVSANGKADPAVRDAYFVEQFGQQGTFVSICQDNFSNALDQIAKLLAKVIGTPCLDDNVPNVDIDPVAPGIQLECLVYDKNTGPTGDPVETIIPRCQMVNVNTPMTNRVPCWWSNVDRTKCAQSATGLTLHVERGGSEPAATTRVVVRCVAQ